MTDPTVQATRACSRNVCPERIPDDGVTRHCSEQCASVEAVRELFADRQAHATMGHGAAVVHALPWLDARAVTA